MKNTFTFLIAFFLFFFLSLNYLYSEEGDVFVTTFFQIDELPVSHDLYNIEYNLDSVKGMQGGEVFWNDHVTLVGGQYRRIAGINDIVRVPAGSKVGVSALIKNESNSNVTLRNWKFFLSRQGSSLANFGIESQSNSERDFVSSSFVANVLKDEVKVFDLKTLEIFQPLKILSFDWEPVLLENGDLEVSVVLKMKNMAEFTLEDIEYVHGDFYEKKDFSPGEEYIYEYVVNFGDEYSSGLNLLDSFEIHSGKSRLECAVMGSSDFSTSLVFEKDGFGEMSDLSWYPNNLAMCIDFIEYSLIGKKLQYEVPVDVEVGFVNEGGELGVGDALNLRVRVKNLGMGLESLSLKLDFEDGFQNFKSSTCNTTVLDSGLLWEIQELNPTSEFFCDFVFDIEGVESFLKLKNELILNDEVADGVVFKYVPDFEMSFEYDYDLEKFVFETTVGDISSVVFSEKFKNGMRCKSVLFLGLEDGICI